jgi:hypothetical protein
MMVPWEGYSDSFGRKQEKLKQKKTAEQLAKHKQSCAKAHSKRKKK